MTAQLQLPRFRVDARTRLVEPSWVQAALHVDYESVEAMIAGGEIPYAFHIGTGTVKREIRIVAECIQDGGRQFADLDAVVNWLLEPFRWPTAHAVMIARLLACTRPLILELHARGELVGHLNGHTRHVTVASVREFLKRRRIT